MNFFLINPYFFFKIADRSWKLPEMLHDACWVGGGEDGGQKRENMVGVHHKLETASRRSVKLFVELPIDVAVLASVEVLFHVALILLLVDPIDNVLTAIY